MRSTRKAIKAVVLFTILASTTLGQNLLTNGDFETDTFTVWPGYVGGDNPEEITGWQRNPNVAGGNVGLNPVIEPQNPSSIIGWMKTSEGGNIGINPVTNGEQPFADNGDSDGGLMFLQGDVSVAQEVTGLTIGEDYVLTVDYNARNCCEDLPAATLELNGEFSDLFPNPDDFIDNLVDPVEVGAWWFAEIPFEAESENLTIEFFSFPDTGGDATFLLDNISLRSASGGDELIVNGDFEADLDQWAVWPGYLGAETAEPRAPFRDNGDNQSQVALLQNAAAIDQEISGLTVGETYTLSIDYNARDCCGAFPIPQLLIDEEPVADFNDDLLSIDPVGADNEWHSFETTVVAEFESLILTIQNMSEPADGDSTLVVDNVFFGIPGGEIVAGDCNGDGTLTSADLSCVAAEDLDVTLQGLGILEGDLDGNGEVAFADFLRLSANFGSSDVGYAGGDIDLDGSVAFADFLVLSANFGMSAAATTPVPEPSSLCLLLVSMLAFRRVFATRRRC